MCQGFSHSSGYLRYFVLAKLATSSIRVMNKIKGDLGTSGNIEGFLILKCFMQLNLRPYTTAQYVHKPIHTKITPAV